MAEPIEYRIVGNMQTALRAISIAGGYHHDVKEVAVRLDADSQVEDLIAKAGPGDVVSTGPRPFIILEVNSFNPNFMPARQILNRMSFSVHMANDTDPKEDGARLKVFMRMCADIEQALDVDHTRGGLASDTKLTERVRADYEGQLVWAICRGEVRVHRTYGEPNG